MILLCPVFCELGAAVDNKFHIVFSSDYFIIYGILYKFLYRTFPMISAQRAGPVVADIYFDFHSDRITDNHPVGKGFIL